MPTTVTSVIGTGGDYTTIAAWEAAQPVSLTASDQIWRGETKNQQFTETITIAGSTTDVTRYAELTTQAGASFRDNVNVQTTALIVNFSAGMTLVSSTAYGTVLNINQNFVRISNMQLQGQSSTTNTFVMAGSFTMDANNCIFYGSRTTPVVQLSGSTAQIRNSLIFQNGSAASAIAQLASGSSLFNCTVVVPTTAITAPTAILSGSYGVPVVKNCALFGNGAALKTGGNTPTYTTCKSDAASLPSGVTSATYNTSLFVGVTQSGADYRLVSGSALIDAGTTDSTNAPIDIATTARPQGSAYDIGCWEYVAAAGADVFLGQACL